MGPRAHRILCAYWHRLRMIFHACGYYGVDFQGFCGMTQGDPLSPTIFNLVVYAVVRHWISLVAGGMEGKYGRGR